MFASNDFNPHVTILNAGRTIASGSHALAATVRSKPGTSLSLEVRFVPGEVAPRNVVQGGNARLEVFDLFDDPDPFAPGDLTGLPAMTQLSITARPLDLPPSGSNEHEMLARARFEIASGASCETVATLVSERTVAGEVGTLVQAPWDGRDGNGVLVPSGIYYYRATVELVRRHVSTNSEQVLDTATTAVQTVFVVDANDPCRQPMVGVEVVAQTSIIGAPGVVRSVPFDLPEPGILCLEVTNPGATPAERTARANLFIDDRHVLDADLFSPDVERLRFGVRMQNSPHVLRVALERGSLLVSARFIATNLVATGPPPGPVTCAGRLLGFEHPFGATALRPLVARGGVEVHCQANYAVSSSVFVEPGDLKTQVTTIPVRQTGLTDSEGRFNITVSPDALTSVGITTQAALQSVVSGCEERPSSCGWEARRGVTTDLVSSGVYAELDVTDVLDVAFQDVGARLVTNGATDADRNDLPVLIHEAIDTSNKQGTRFLVWDLSGKALDFRDFVGDENDVCDIGRAKQCLEFTDDCNPALCSDAASGIRCFGAPGMQALLAAGYDVWIIDHLDGKKDITQIAAQSPALYERIIAYPAPDPDRKIGVIGVSLGGVVARMALKLWEKQARFAPGGPGLPGVTNFLGGQLRLAETPTDRSRDRVGLYVSFDAPHRGARVPRALQAYIQHATEVATEEAGDLGEELNAPPSVQLMEEFVVGPFFPSAAPPGSSCNADCFFLDDGDLDSHDCCLTDDQPTHIQSAATHAFADALSASMIDAIDRQADDPFGRPPDGLPDNIPSIAISNGNRSGTRNVGSEQSFMVVTINASPAPDDTHTLSTTLTQPAGSQWFGMCRGGDIAGNVGGGFEIVSEFLFDPLGQVTCFSVGGLGGFFSACPASCWVRRSVMVSCSHMAPFSTSISRSISR